MPDRSYDLEPDTWLYGHSDDVYVLDVDAPQPSQIIDDFEDNDLSEYRTTDPENTWHTKRSNAMGGNYILEGSAADTGYNSYCMSDSSLPNLPSRGDTFAFDWEARSSIISADNSKFFIIFANQNTSNQGIHDHYAVEHELGGQEIDVERDTNGTDVSLGDRNVSFDNYTRYRTTIGFNDDGSDRIHVHIRNKDTGSTVIDYYSESDTNYDSGGIGFYIRHDLNVWIDNITNLSV